MRTRHAREIRKGIRAGRRLILVAIRFPYKSQTNLRQSVVRVELKGRSALGTEALRRTYDREQQKVGGILDKALDWTK